ncbi:MAG: hypothetical protein A3C47_02365 [Omnitrophica bacterium RIFCSPHIGHO2_02_FULL_51_18]|nr:MAG: hypothetical protein A3C47_02365 [Omnitrophica bacterium RIFCSPHIGHO2_02_FULL_51_18]
MVLQSGFTEDMSHKLLDSLFKELTTLKLIGLLKAEFKDPLVLDGFRRDAKTSTWHRAQGPRVITHIFSGNVPNPSIVSFVLGMLVKSKNVGKVSSKDKGFLDIYLDSLKMVDCGLASGNSLLKANNKKALERSIQASDLVVVYGDDRTLSEVRKMIPSKTRFIGYGHRVSFGICLKETLTKRNLSKLARNAATDIWMMDQRGCLSPAVIYLETGGEVSPLLFSQHVTKHLSRYGRWLTLYDDAVSDFPKICEGKVIHFQAFNDIEKVYKKLKPIRLSLQSVALEGNSVRRQGAALRLAQLGINRICRAGQMQNPPITWHHDGMPNLASWVRWTDLETR